MTKVNIANHPHNNKNYTQIDAFVAFCTQQADAWHNGRADLHTAIDRCNNYAAARSIPTDAAQHIMAQLFRGDA